jgi:hypothetical protein
VNDETAVNKGVKLKLQSAVRATVSVTDAYGKPIPGALVQMRVSPRPDGAWWTAGKTDSAGRLAVNALYPNGVYTFRAMRAGYKTDDTGGLPRVGSAAWINNIEIVLEKNDGK